MKAFHCSVLIDGLADAPVHDGIVVVEDGTIIEAGPADVVSPPAGADRIDHDVMLPGLIDAHVHLLGTPTTDPTERLRDDTALKAARATSDLRDLLGAGFTSVRDMGSEIGIGLRDAVAEGAIPGPRIRSSGLRFSQTAGHGDVHSLPHEWVGPGGAGTATLVDGVAECRREARKRVREGADLLKVMTTGGVLSEIDQPDQTHFTTREVEVLVEEAHRFGLPVGCHASGADGIKMALRAGVDTIEHGTYLDQEAIDLLLELDVPVVTTATPMHKFVTEGPEHDLPEHAVETAQEINEAHLQSMRRAHDAGVALAAGSDLMGTELLPHGENAIEPRRLVEAVGMDELAALQATTSTAARAFGDESVGAVEAGRQADLLALNADPLEDIGALREIEAVYKAGRRVAG